MALELAEARQAGHTARCEGDQSLLAPGWSPCPGRQGGCCSDPGGRAWGSGQDGHGGGGLGSCSEGQTKRMW